MDETTEQRILTGLRTLANRWHVRHHTVLLDYDDYYVIGLQAYYAARDQWAGSDPLVIERCALMRANWDMADAMRRSVKRENRQYQDYDATLQELISQRSLKDHADIKRRDLSDLLRKVLPAHQAEIAISFLVEGYTLPEIAKRLGMPAATVRWRWEHARQTMKQSEMVLRFLADCKYGT